jgi:RNA polymerase sigma factor (sigma-70 family)
MNQDDGSGVAGERRERFCERILDYLKKLFAVVFSITHDREISQDIAQQTITNYLNRMEKAGWNVEIDNETAYLVQSAKNLIKDRWEENSKAEIVSFDDEPDDGIENVVSEPVAPSSNIDDRIYFCQLLAMIPWKTVLRGFSSDQLYLFGLHLEGWSNEEIATEVNKEVEVVRYQLQKVTATIRNRIRKIFGEEVLFNRILAKRKGV